MRQLIKNQKVQNDTRQGDRSGVRTPARLSPLLFAFIVGVLVTFGLPAGAAAEGPGPLDDLTHEPCFGPEDPFCTEEDDGPGAGGQRVCYNCTIEPGVSDFECDPEGSTEDECSIVHDSQGDRHCRLTGNPCW